MTGLVSTFAAIAFAPACARAADASPLAQAAALAAEAAAGQKTTVVGTDGWMYFAPELRHLGVGRFWGDAAESVSRATKPEFADPLPAIVDFNRQLEGAGIALILVPVPPKAVIYPEHLFANFDEESVAGGRIDEVHQVFYELLREQGVEVLDLVPAFLEAKETTQMFCKQDTHWSGQACVEVARIVKERLTEVPWFAAHPKSEYASEMAGVEITGDLW
ncbi:MAG: alginate O-acetyltransferase AlgX-related protein, partial [Opitutaceae bacterium]